MAEEARRRGRPSKGIRQGRTVRMHPDLAAATERAAQRQGYESTSDYIAAVLAQRLEMPEFEPRRGPQRERLNLSA